MPYESEMSASRLLLDEVDPDAEHALEQELLRPLRNREGLAVADAVVALCRVLGTLVGAAPEEARDRLCEAAVAVVRETAAETTVRAMLRRVTAEAAQ